MNSNPSDTTVATSPIDAADFLEHRDSSAAATPVESPSQSGKETNNMAFEMLDLADLTDNLSVASAGEAAASNTSESSHMSSNLLKLDTKGCIGIFERLPLCAKIILLVLFSALGLAAVSAITIALSSKSLSTSRAVSRFISQGQLISRVLYSVQQERKGATFMMTDPTNPVMQVSYLKSISATDSAMAFFDSTLKSNIDLYGVLYADFEAKRESMSELRAKTTARILDLEEMLDGYQVVIEAILSLVHRSNAVLGYDFDTSTLGLYNEYNEATIQTSVLASIILSDPSSRDEILPSLIQYYGERNVTQRMLLFAGTESVVNVFRKGIIDTPQQAQFLKNIQEIIAKPGNYSFSFQDHIGVSVEFLEMFEKQSAEALFSGDIELHVTGMMNQAISIIVVVAVVVAVFAVLSCTNATLFARSIVGPWQRLNAVQEATISKFVPKGFLSLMGWKSIAQATLGKCLEQDATVVVVKITEFSKLEAEIKEVQQLYSFVNTYLAYVGPYIRNNSGYIDKFSGSHFVAIFQKDKKAIKSALEIQQAMVNFNKMQSHPVALRITIVSGKTVMGTIGENERMESVSMSRTMKTAFQLQRVAKKANAFILTTRETLSRIPQHKSIQHRFIGTIKTKSDAFGTDLCELLSFADPAKIKTKDHFSKAVRLMQTSRFQEALSVYEAILHANPGDSLAVKYRDMTKQTISENVRKLSGISVCEVLSDHCLRSALEQHCIQEHSTENINLWNEIQSYKDAQSAEERRMIATRICNEFLQIHGKQAVNLSEEQVASVRRVVLNSNSTLSPMLFVDIEALAEHLMVDTVKRLKNTTQFKQEFMNSSVASRLEEISLS